MLLLCLPRPSSLRPLRTLQGSQHVHDHLEAPARGHDASTCRDSRINAIDRHLSFQFTLITALDYLFTAAVVVRAALHYAQPRQIDMGVLLSARDGRNFRC